jgi:hypothetical protein
MVLFYNAPEKLESLMHIDEGRKLPDGCTGKTRGRFRDWCIANRRGRSRKEKCSEIVFISDYVVLPVL